MSGRRGLRDLIDVPGVILRVETDAPRIALTFDDGPDPETTLPLLEILEAHGARGTFFMRGAAVVEHPDVVRRVRAGGHEVANHTWSHPVLPRIGAGDRILELRRCQAALAAHGGSRLFRPPYLAFSKRARVEALLMRLEVIYCNVSSEDWRLSSSQEILDRLLENPSGGDIVLLHDTIYVPEDRRFNHSHLTFRDRGPMMAAMESYLSQTREHFQHVTVSELLESGRPVREARYRAGPTVVSEPPGGGIGESEVRN